MIRIKLDTQRLTVPIRVHQRHRHHILLRIDAPIIAQTQRPVQSGVRDGSPEVYDLEATFEEVWDL